MTANTGLGHGRTGKAAAAVLRSASVAAGVAAAALLVVDFRLTGPTGRQVLVVALTAAFVSACTGATSSLTALMMRPSLRRAQGLLAEEPDLWGSDREFFAPMRRLMFLGVLQALVDLLVLLTVYPLALWAGVRICAAVGLPARLTGLWPVFLSGLLVAAVATTAATFFALFRRRTGRAAARSLAAVLLNAAGLALALLVLDGVHLDAAPGWRQALALCAVASLFMLPRITLSLPVPGIASIVLVAYHCLLLWLICAAFAFADPGLHIDGFRQLAGAAAIMWAAEWPARLAVRRAQGAAARPAPLLPDPFPPDHGFPTGPLY
ncbi:hypothetical protein [Streptomyces avidinii]|uniref:Uncharacterized protein n=1 Tax=Streptomyces avidinii TaxID=1895 RepID=A0ABS4KW58_STRAV|nr:hypothetical protein [Streptomyces avidinii]MBP2034273.1 hypothetical protein [Streptomyces avidinii]GGZ35449.1 hypothetical protein GCM10010343_73410 [Streptomyces avidinii]